MSSEISENCLTFGLNIEHIRTGCKIMNIINDTEPFIFEIECRGFAQANQ